MTEVEIGKLLTVAASYDNRVVSRETVRAWFEVLGDLVYEDALRALVNHFKSSTAYLMPVHIRSGVRQINGGNQLVSNASLYCKQHWYPQSECPKCEGE